MLEEIGAQDNYLDCSKLSVGARYKKVCYVHNVRSGTDVYNSGFYTFFIKDKNATVVPARLFNVKDFVEKGFDAIYLKNKPVTIEFIAQVYNKRWSFVLDDIQLYQGDFDYSVFVGTVPAIDTAKLEKVYKVIDSNYECPAIYQTMSLQSICQGRRGGPLLVYNNVTSNLLQYCKLNSVVPADLLKVFDVCYRVFIDLEQEKQKLDVISCSAELNLLQKVYYEYKDNDLYEIMLDTLNAIIHGDKPKHLYANLICNELKSVMQNLELCYVYDSLVSGGSANVKGADLLRY